MGQEISQSTFSDEQRDEFRSRLRAETSALKEMFDGRAFDFSEGFNTGLELEAWLLDENHLPAPRSDDFLTAVGDPRVVGELSQFNFELNVDPQDLSGDFLSRSERALDRLWRRCVETADAMDLHAAFIGILPTVRDEMLQPAWMSQSNRYDALNRELFHLRKDEPIHIDIEGEERLDYQCRHIMLEAACTSLQAHLKINQEDAVRFYNASVLASGPLVAAAANAPFLYGKSLWAETRIPAFEQSTAVHGFRDAQGRRVMRVTLGRDYLRHSFLELFLDNLGYPPLLPDLKEGDETLPHLRLQNGTVWRWNRPIIGFDKAGKPHLRIEQRVMPAGPTITDSIANLALYFGIALALAKAETPPEFETPFEAARSNFYACAKDGLNARVEWAGRPMDVQALLLERLLPDAKEALVRAGADRTDCAYYFDDVLRQRLLSGRNGAKWQRSFIRVNGCNFQSLTERYVDLQRQGAPVHAWVA